MPSKSTTIQVAIIALLLAVLVVPSTGNAQVRSLISGECDCDSLTGQTLCEYTVLSGSPALSHIIMPIAENCAEIFSITSPFFTFGSPQLHKDNFCGEIFGIKADQELAEGQMTTITIIYDGCFRLGVDVIYAALKGGPNCELFPVEGVVDCDPPSCIKWSLDAEVVDFQIRKPGAYTSCLATMTLEANCQVNVGFESFGDLIPVRSTDQDPISAFYATTPPDQTDPPAEFLPPADFNQHTLVVPMDAGEYRFSIWGKIVIGNEVTACEYGDDATISLELENHITYVDPEQ